MYVVNYCLLEED
jgi:hypothetical protein